MLKVIKSRYFEAILYTDKLLLYDQYSCQSVGSYHLYQDSKTEVKKSNLNEHFYSCHSLNVEKNPIESTLYLGQVLNTETLTFNQYCLDVPTANFPAKIFWIK